MRGRSEHPKCKPPTLRRPFSARMCRSSHKFVCLRSCRLLTTDHQFGMTSEGSSEGLAWGQGLDLPCASPFFGSSERQTPKPTERTPGPKH